MFIVHVSAASFTIKVQFYIVSASGRLSNFFAHQIFPLIVMLYLFRCYCILALK